MPEFDDKKTTQEGQSSQVSASQVRQRRIGLVSTLLIVGGLAAIGWSLWQGGAMGIVRRLDRWSASFFGDGEEAQSQTTSDSGVDYFSFLYPTDKFFLTDQRQAYADGAMVISIPRLGLTASVGGGTTPEYLQAGPGLYEYSPLPSWGNPNVCIAAHRGVYGAEFHDLDALLPDDPIYLYYKGYVFTYGFNQYYVVDEDDWTHHYCGETSVLTLSTCDFQTAEIRLLAHCTLLSVQEGAPPAQIESNP